MARKIHCKICGQPSTKDEAIKIKNGYVHEIDCYAVYIDAERKKAKEKFARSQLLLTIAEIHGLDSPYFIPSAFFGLLENLRSTGNMYSKPTDNTKKICSYEWLRYTYEYSRASIQWAKKNREFKNLISELKYSLCIVRNNLHEAKREYLKEQQEEKRREEVKKADIKRMEEDEKNEEREYAVKKDNGAVDISDFLD